MTCSWRTRKGKADFKLQVPWFYPSELSTTRVRSRMQAIASGWNWMAVFAVVKITPIAIGKLAKHGSR